MSAVCKCSRVDGAQDEASLLSVVHHRHELDPVREAAIYPHDLGVFVGVRYHHRAVGGDVLLVHRAKLGRPGLHNLGLKVNVVVVCGVVMCRVETLGRTRNY